MAALEEVAGRYPASVGKAISPAQSEKTTRGSCCSVPKVAAVVLSVVEWDREKKVSLSLL